MNEAKPKQECGVSAYSKDRPSSCCWPWEIPLPDTDKGDSPSKTAAKASVREREAREREENNNKRQMEELAYVQLIARRAENLSEDLSAVAKLLREQHAVCTQDGPHGQRVPSQTSWGTISAPYEIPTGDRNKAPRPWRLLLGSIREVLGGSADTPPKVEVIRVHTPRERFSDWAGSKETGHVNTIVDTLERRRRTDVSEHNTRTRRYNLSGANKEN